MQKKVLIPLMLTLPATMPALANIPLGFQKDGDWSKTDITSDEWIKSPTEVNCPVGTATVTANFSNLPKGKYFVRFASSDNVAMKVGDQPVAINGEKSASFDFDGNGILSIEFTGATQTQGFSFEVKCIVLEVAEDAYTTVRDAYSLVYNAQLDEVVAEDDFQEAADLRAQHTNFIDNSTKFNGVSMGTVLDNLREMSNANDGIDNMQDSQEWIALYREYGLDKDPSTVLAAQTEWQNWVTDYNARVEAENAVWARYLQNVATRTTLLEEQAALLTQANALKETIANFKVVDDALKEEYVNSINAYIEKLEQYKASIEAAYADPAGPDRRNLRDEITFTDQKPELETELNDLQTAFNSWAEDYRAYYDINFIQLTNLKNAYDAYVTFLKGVKGIENWLPVYNDLVYGGDDTENPTADSKLGVADRTYNDTKAANQIEAVEGATEGYQEKLDAINAVIEGWETLTDEFQTVVDTQNTNMTSAQEELTIWNEKVAGYNQLDTDGKVPSSMKTEFDSKLNAVTDAIAAFKQYTDTHYQAHDLDLNNIDYQNLLRNANGAISDMEMFLAPMETIQNLLEQLEEAHEAVGRLNGGSVSGDDEGETADVNISDRFKSTYEDLKNAILALTIEDAEDTAITNPIVEQIAKYLRDAQDYAADLTAANRAITAINNKYTDLLAFLDAKIFDQYNDTENTNLKTIKDSYKTSWTTMFDTPIKGLRNDFYQAVIKTNDQESFTALRDLVAHLTTVQGENGALSSAVFDAQKQAFALAGTNANKAFATTLLNNFENNLEAAVAAGVTNADTIDSDPICNEFGTIFSMIEDDSTPTELGVIDNKIKAALDRLQILVNKLADLKQNQANYDALKAAWDALVPSLEGLRDYNDKSSLEPALTFFDTEKIGTVEEPKTGTLAERINTLETALSTALKDTKIVTDEQKAAFQEQIDSISAGITATRAAIELNNNKHNSQLAKEKEERAHALDVIAQIDAKGEADGSADLEVMKTWKAELQSLIDNDIVNENIVVTNAYGTGQSAAQDEEIMGVYQEIHNKIQAIEDQLNGDAYKQAVIGANTATTQNWGTEYDKLMDDWRKAIQDFNYYYYDLTNKGWRDDIHDDIKRHQEEFASHKDIDDLNDQVRAYIEAQNAAPHVITQAEWQTWLDKANDISTAINDRVEALENEANGLAEAYYTTLHGTAQNAFNDAEAALIDAGIDPTTYLAKANGLLSNAESMYNAALTGTLRVDNLGRVMNAIADELDKVIPSIDVQAACQAAWDAEYADAQEKIQEMRDAIAAAEFCPDEVKAAWMQDFEEKAGLIDALNTEVKGVTEGLVSSYAGYVETLKELLSGMQSDADAIKNASDLNKQNQDIYDNFNNAWYPDLNNQYDALKEFCNALGGSGSMEGTLDNIKNSIEALKAYVEAEKANLLDKDIEGEYENIKAAIANAYETAAEAEISWLRNIMLRKTKVAFNDALVKIPEDTTLDQRLAELGYAADKYNQAAIEEDIHRISDAMDTFTYDADDKEGFKTTAQGFEKDLCDYYDALQSTWNEQAPSVGVKAGLDEIYNTILGLITDGQTTLGECLESVQTEFAGQYETLKEALDAQKAGWDANGSDVIAREAGYKANLKDIEDAVNDLTAQIAEAQQIAFEKAEKERINNEKYTELKGQYDSLQSAFDEAKALVESYGNGIADRYADYAAGIQTMLDSALAELDAANAKVALKADSELLNAALIASSIDTYKTNATRAYAGVQFTTLGDKDSELATLMRSHIVPAVYAEISAALTPLRDNVADIRGEYQTADFDRLNEIITEAKGYIENYDELIGKATDNTFIPGDVNLDGSVDVFDAQTLINLIGEGMTYEQLYAENPLEACAADVLNDNQINVADVTSIIYLVQGVDVNTNRARAAKAVAQSQQTAKQSLMLVSQEDGVSRYALVLNNPVAFIAGQFEIKVSGNSRVTGITAADRVADHEVYAYETENGGARVVLVNMENKEFADNDGVLVYIDVEGDNNLSVINGLYVDANNFTHVSGDGHTSAIDTILDNVKEGAQHIWDAAGRQFRSIQRGINIIRHKDGRVTKEIHK